MNFKRLSYFSVLVSLVLLPLIFLINSCKHSGVPADQLPQICFTDQVLPIFQNSCATSGCHDARRGESRYVFTDYAGIMAGVTPGNADKSKVYKSLIGGEHLMPPNNPLPESKRTLIRVWIEQGAKETTCATTNTTTASTLPDTTGTIGYDSHIKSIVDLSCASYHGSTNPSGGIDLTTKSGLQAVAESGKLLAAIIRIGNFPMPPAYALSDCEVKQFELWTKQGYN